MRRPSHPPSSPSPRSNPDPDAFARQLEQKFDGAGPESEESDPFQELEAFEAESERTNFFNGMKPQTSLLESDEEEADRTVLLNQPDLMNTLREGLKKGSQPVTRQTEQAPETPDAWGENRRHQPSNGWMKSSREERTRTPEPEPFEPETPDAWPEPEPAVRQADIETGAFDTHPSWESSPSEPDAYGSSYSVEEPDTGGWDQEFGTEEEFGGFSQEAPNSFAEPVTPESESWVATFDDTLNVLSQISGEQEPSTPADTWHDEGEEESTFVDETAPKHYAQPAPAGRLRQQGPSPVPVESRQMEAASPLPVDQGAFQRRVLEHLAALHEEMGALRREISALRRSMGA